MALRLHYFSGGPRERVLSALLQAGHVVEKVFVNDASRWPKIGPTIELAKGHGIAVEVVERKLDLDRIIPEVADKTCLSVGFNYIFPSRLIASARVVLNVHGSLLPKYAGARTLGWVIENGEMESGVTVHQVDEGIDTGPILLQKAFALSPFETTRSLARKTALFEPSVVLEALLKYESEGLARALPQGRCESLWPNRTPEHSRLDPQQPLIALVDKIRAADPDDYPAYFEINGERVCLRMWRRDKSADEADLI
jgi:methionyl-tRNA formyltransferase